MFQRFFLTKDVSGFFNKIFQRFFTRDVSGGFQDIEKYKLERKRERNRIAATKCRWVVVLLTLLTTQLLAIGFMTHQWSTLLTQAFESHGKIIVEQLLSGKKIGFRSSLILHPVLTVVIC